MNYMKNKCTFVCITICQCVRFRFWGFFFPFLKADFLKMSQIGWQHLSTATFKCFHIRDQVCGSAVPLKLFQCLALCSVSFPCWNRNCLPTPRFYGTLDLPTFTETAWCSIYPITVLIQCSLVRRIHFFIIIQTSTPQENKGK